MKISTTTAVFDAEIERVWNIVTDNAEWEWRSDLSKIEITGENTFTEFAKNGFPTRFTITEKKEHERYEFDMDNKNFSGHWTGIFRAAGEKQTEVTFIEQLRVKNPVMRVFSAAFMNIKKFQLAYIEDMRARLENR